MATPSKNRAFQAYNSHQFPNNSPIKTSPIATFKEPLIFGRIPYSTIRTTVDTTSSTPPSPNLTTLVKPTALTPKRRASVSSIGHFLPRRKSLQTTALASQRQSLWMNIAKNAQTNNTQLSPFPLRQHQPNLLRKKLLRLLLVFSYLLSISLFGVALATFYGFFWSGYSPSKTGADVPTLHIPTNSSIIGMNLVVDDVSFTQKKNMTNLISCLF